MTKTYISYFRFFSILWKNFIKRASPSIKGATRLRLWLYERKFSKNAFLHYQQSFNTLFFLPTSDTNCLFYFASV